ncbi:signal recognition particle protein Srp19 [Candidatus Bathyarchaeota archaeon]|nr:signal recognition particle protein Srp19 [Candidatus Bathyarchaeota archaeon]
MKKPGKIVVWPANIDLKKTRSKGRKISKKMAVESPKLEEIIEASRKLGLNPIPASQAALPKEWWNKTGYVIVERKDKGKIQVLKSIAVEVNKNRKIEA